MRVRFERIEIIGGWSFSLPHIQYHSGDLRIGFAFYRWLFDLVISPQIPLLKITGYDETTSTITTEKPLPESLKPGDVVKLKW